jgi:hypothetical protein
VNISCGCADRELDDVKALMDSGLDQHTASRMVWGDLADVRTYVRTEFRRRFPWLRLPERWS